jgi:hypothetical protein
MVGAAPFEKANCNIVPGVASVIFNPYASLPKEIDLLLYKSKIGYLSLKML